MYLFYMIQSPLPFPKFDKLSFLLSSSLFTLFTSLITLHSSKPTNPLACCQTAGFPLSTLRKSRTLMYEESCSISTVRSNRRESIKSRFAIVLFARAAMRHRMSRRWLWISSSLTFPLSRPARCCVSGSGRAM